MIPDYCEPLTSYRCWNVFPNGLMVGQAHAEPWPPFEAFVGRCGFARSPKHVKQGQWQPAPLFDCDCGVHALKDASGAEQRLIDEAISASQSFGVRFYLDDYRPPLGRVWGAVKLWGRVIEHEIGYRAEFAYPSALFCQDAKLAVIVSALYGVPCEVKKLAIPKQKPQDEDFSWYSSVVSYQPIAFKPFSNYYGLTTPYAPPPPPVQQPGLIQQPTLSAIKALGASPWQKKQAQPAPQADWRDVMKKAFHVKKDDSIQA